MKMLIFCFFCLWHPALIPYLQSKIHVLNIVTMQKQFLLCPNFDQQIFDGSPSTPLPLPTGNMLVWRLSRRKNCLQRFGFHSMIVSVSYHYHYNHHHYFIITMINRGGCDGCLNVDNEANSGLSLSWKPLTTSTKPSNMPIFSPGNASWADVLRIHLKMHSGEKSNKCNQVVTK